jgi:anti-sigma regulatory factor (Ser/Thr protein kinase)
LYGDWRSPVEFGPKPSSGGPRTQRHQGVDEYLDPGSFAACGLDGGLRNARQARRFAGITLHGWGMDALVPDMELVVSELVTNAVRHALAEPSEGPAGYPLWLGLFRHPGHVVCTVTDPSSDPPRPCAPEALELGGRGLALISELSDSWSWSLTPPCGKAVWASLAPRS